MVSMTIEVSGKVHKGLGSPGERGSVDGRFHSVPPSLHSHACVCDAFTQSVPVVGLMLERSSGVIPCLPIPACICDMFSQRVAGGWIDVVKVFWFIPSPHPSLAHISCVHPLCSSWLD